MEKTVFKLKLLQNNNGFTLIEVIVAFAIILIGLLGLLEGVNIALKQNTNNQQREEVVRVAEQVMNDMRTRAFPAVFNPITTVKSTLKMGTATYLVMRTSQVITADVSERYNVDVRWRYGNYSATHSISSVRGK
jgi:prepilin-type N-terminal cleavage/methylation domain-containing protein